MLHGDSLERFSLTHGSNDFGGYVTEVEPPVFKRKVSERRAGGMPAPVKTAHGWEEATLKFKAVGNRDEIYELFINKGISGQRVIIKATFEDELENQFHTEKYVCEGRVIEANPGTYKADEDIEVDVEMSLTYYQHSYKGEVRFEIDILGDSVNVNGTDETAGVNATLGRRSS